MAGRKGPRPGGGRSTLDGIHDIAANLAGAVLIIITLIVLAGIGSRLFFGRPLPATDDLIGSCLMVALTYLALSSSVHIRITVLTRLLPARAARWTENVVVAVSAAGLALAVWAGLAIAVNSFRTGESTVGLYTFDIAPFRFLIVVGLLLLLLRIAREGRGWLREDVEEVPRGTAPRQAGPSGQSTTSDSTKDG
jgi:TRAP-type C4-dicarboxylate transport system permease small subunit